MPKLPKQVKTDYSLRRRFFTKMGEPLEWQDFGCGQWQGIELAQEQINTLAIRNRRVEIEFIHEGKLCGYDGKETGKTIIYLTR
jgi:hypothetical protein